MFGAVPRSVVRASARRFTSKTLARPTSDLARSCRRGRLVSGENLGGYEKDWRGDSCYGWKRDQGAAWRGLSTATPPSKGGPPEKDGEWFMHDLKSGDPIFCRRQSVIRYNRDRVWVIRCLQPGFSSLLFHAVTRERLDTSTTTSRG